MSPLRLTRVDALIRPDHHYLTEKDECYFLGEYTARAGYAFSEMNDLILNLKKSLDLRDTNQWRWKTRAIKTAGEILREALTAADNNDWLQSATLVPIPPSRAKADPLYDDRLVKVLTVVAGNRKLDIRELLLLRETMHAAHDRDRRPTPNELINALSINQAVVEPEPAAIGIFDDVITTGAHFVAAKALLADRFPNRQIVGIFLARRVPGSDL